LARTEEVRPLPTFERMLARLTGPEPAQRARAMAELARAPEASARALVRHFPGPTAWSRATVSELPGADELGPIPGALARLGRAAAQALAPLLDADDPDARYFALLTAGSLPYAELVPGVLRGLFDLEPEISSAARVTASAMKRLPRFDTALRGLRQELTALDPLRRSLAARALGALHDRESVDGLIGLTGSEDPLCAQAAAEALFEITRANFGGSTRAWTGWWAENRGRRRSEWLVDALGHREGDTRAAAYEELSAALGDALGYGPEAPVEVRREAQVRWQRALGDPRLRAVD
jgi:HEAT repeat protein